MTVPAPGPARHFIRGRFVDPADGEWYDRINAATEEPTVTWRGNVADVDRAVEAAKDAFDDGVWSRAKPSFRRQVTPASLP